MCNRTENPTNSKIISTLHRILRQKEIDKKLFDIIILDVQNLVDSTYYQT